MATTQDDGGAAIQPTINPAINGNTVLDTAKIIPDGVWNKTNIEINPVNYKINYGDTFELIINPPSGGTPDYQSSDLLIKFLFIPEVT
jgi:hypothetical protein